MHNVRIAYKRVVAPRDTSDEGPHAHAVPAVEIHSGFESNDLARIFAEVRAVRLELKKCFQIEYTVESDRNAR